MDVLGFRVYEAVRQDRYPLFDDEESDDGGGGGPSRPGPSTGGKGGKKNAGVNWNERHMLEEIFPLERENIGAMSMAALARTASATQATAITVPNTAAPSTAAGPSTAKMLTKDTVRVDNHTFLDAKHWKKANLIAALQARGLAHTGINKVLKDQLFQHEADRLNATPAANANANANQTAGPSDAQNDGDGPAPAAPVQDVVAPGWNADFQNRLPRADLGDWGIRRQGQFILDVQSDYGLNALDCLTWAILLGGYNPTYWVSRAYLFYELRFYDLALGDCYRAFRLIETLEDAARRNMMPGLYIRVWDAVEGHIVSMGDRNAVKKLAKTKARGQNGVNYFIPTLRKALHHIISKSLFKMQCWEDYLVWDEYLTKRLLMPHRDKTAFIDRRKEVEDAVKSRIQDGEQDARIYFFEKRFGVVEGKAYPQTARDVDRGAEAFQNRVTEMYLRGWNRFADEMLEIRPWRDGFGVFATRDITMDDVLYSDEPSARGHLDRTARPPIFEKDHGVRPGDQNFAQEPRCENCRRDIDLDTFRRRKTSQTENPNPQGPTFACACSDDSVVAKKYFCHRNWHQEAGPAAPPQDATDEEEPESTSASAAQGGKGKRKRKTSTTKVKPKKKQKKGKEPATTVPTEQPDVPRTCFEIARRLYHYKSCGKDWEWLQKAMMPIWHLENRGRPVMDGTRGIRGGRYLTHNNEKHGTVLSMILRDVLDIALLQRTEAGRHNLLAHETEEMLPLCGAEHEPERLFPFGWAANIMVPFEMLLNLGVDIFTDLAFDTWVIQTVLRKLLMNVVPADESVGGRDEPEWGKTDPVAPVDPPQGYLPEASSIVNPPAPPPGDQTYSLEDVKAEMENVYLHTGFAMFNHGCGTARNAVWLWDTETPNRIIVKAETAIAAGEQVLVGYLYDDADLVQLQRLFGARGCVCEECERVS